MARKPRTDAVLLHLPMEQQKQLAEWLLDGGLSYRAAAAAMDKDFQVKTSATAVFDFYHTVCAPELSRRRAVAVSTAEDIASEAEATPGRWDAAALDKLKQQAFEMAMQPGADPKAIKSFFTVIAKAKDQELKERDLALAERKVALMERKAAQADEASKVVGDEQLTPEQKQARLKQIFGMG
jgi:hypothetical protein